jgi:hypothetical protein
MKDRAKGLKLRGFSHPDPKRQTKFPSLCSSPLTIKRDVSIKVWNLFFLLEFNFELSRNDPERGEHQKSASSYI